MSESKEELPPHGIRGFASSDVRYEIWAIYGVLLLLLLITVYFVFTRSRRRKERESVPTPVDPIKDLVGQVRDSFPGERFDGVEQQDYFYLLSSRLRQLIERVTAIPAAETTLRELTPQIREKLPLPAVERDRIIGFLERADQIKYAGVAADRGEAEAARENVLQWMLQLTRAP